MVLETTHFALEINTFSAGDERVGNEYSNFSHTYTVSYQQLPNKVLLSSPLKMGAIPLWRSKRYLDARWLLRFH